jgi:hypothetical protein
MDPIVRIFRVSMMLSVDVILHKKLNDVKSVDLGGYRVDARSLISYIVFLFPLHSLLCWLPTTCWSIP